MIVQRPSALHMRDREIAAMPLAVVPEFASPLRTVAFFVMGSTVFGLLFAACLS